MIRFDVRRAVADIERQFGPMKPNQVNAAIARAINHTSAKAKTASSKAIRSRYKVKASDLSKAINITKATSQSRTAYIVHFGNPLPVRAFSPRQTKRGVSVNISGTRKIIAKSFLAVMPSGHEAVFARGYYAQQFQFRTQRGPKGQKRGGVWPSDLPIESLKTRSVPGMLMYKTVLEKVAAQIGQDFPARFTHELARMVAK